MVDGSSKPGVFLVVTVDFSLFSDFAFPHLTGNHATATNVDPLDPTHTSISIKEEKKKQVYQQILDLIYLKKLVKLNGILCCFSMVY